jgi:hypothetical protein
MRRRQVAAFALAAAASPGCLAGTDVGDDGSPPSDTTSLVDEAFEVTGGECGSGLDEAEASFDDGRVEVTGSISARDRCRRARLATVGYDPDADRLSATVETYTAADVCAQCISDLSYTATFTFDGGLPAEVVVTHVSRGRRKTVLEASREA